MMHWNGLIIGIVAFLSIGVFHPIVIKAEYYLSAKCWPAFLVAGLFFCGVSLLVENTIVSSALAVVGFSCLWSIGELKEQEQRVARGWFPKNSNRKS